MNGLAMLLNHSTASGLEIQIEALFVPERGIQRSPFNVLTLRVHNIQTQF